MNKLLFTFYALFLLIFSGYSQTQSDEYISSVAQLEKGIEYYQKGEFKSAIDEYKKIHRNDTNYAIAVSELALAYYLDEQYEESYQACMQGLSLKSEFDNIFYRTACIALKKLKKTKEAEELFKTAIEKFPYEYLLYYNYGLFHEENRNIDLAIRDYQNAITTNPMHAASHYRLGRIYALNQKPVQGMLAMQMALLLDQSNSSSFNILKMLEESVNGSITEIPDSVKVKLPDDNYGEIEELIESKVCLASGYKNKTKLNYVLPRQTQLLLEKLTYNASDKDFFMQMYVPFFTEASRKGYLSPMVYVYYASVNDDEIQSLVKKNKSKITDFYKWVYEYLRTERKYRTQLVDESNVKLTRYFYNNDRIEAKGQYKDEASLIKKGTWVYYHVNGIISDVQHFDDEGKLHGEWKVYYKSGELRNSSNFNHGKRTGQTVSYYANGEKELEYPSVNGNAEGEFRAYYPSGQLSKVILYKEDKKNGVAITYFSNGEKKAEMNYVNDILEGEYKEYYESGELSDVAQYKNGKMEGIVKTYHKNGKLKIECTAKGGVFIGKWTEYYDNGNSFIAITFDDLGVLKEKKQYYTDGKKLMFELIPNPKDIKKTTEREYFESGKLYSEFNYESGIIKDYKIYNEQGTIISEAKEIKGQIKIVNKDKKGNLVNTGEYLKGKQEGEWIYYDYNGNVKSKYTYKNGLAEGPAYEYYSDGTVYREFFYKNDQLDGIAKSFYKNKNLSSKGWYVDGSREGEWWEYHANGNVESKLFYVSDEPAGYREFFAVDGKKISEYYYEYDFLNKGAYFDTTGAKFHEFTLKNGSGDYISKFPNKQVNAIGKYVNGMSEGAYTWNFANGKLATKGAFLHDRKNGKFISYYDNGKVRWEGTYKNGNAEGEWNWYSANGKKYKTGYYKNNGADSLWTYYAVNGKIEYTVYYKDDEKDGHAIYYTQDGDLQIRKTFKEGKFISYSYLDKNGQFVTEIPVMNENVDVIAYFSNGKKSVEEKIVKGYYEGPRTFYYPSGTIEVFNTYKGNMKEGNEICNYPNGKVKSQEGYFYDELDGKSQYFRENGSKESEGTYLLGEKHGVWNYYDENGILIKTVVYWYDQPISETKNGKMYAEK